MCLRTCSVLLLLLSACVATQPSPKEQAAGSLRLANLQRAAVLPWTDDGRCVVQEAGNEWPVLAERCFHALDHERLQFQDPTGRCAVAAAGAAAAGGVALCILAAPEMVVGAVVVLGVVVVAVAIAEELEAYERRGRIAPEATREVERPVPQPQPTTEEPLADRSPEPESSPLGRDWLPPGALEPLERRPECTPKRVPPKGGHPLHDQCADNVPRNAFRGSNVLVNGKAFDALQPAERMLWEVKATAIETYNSFIQKAELDKQVTEGRRERALAEACGYGFVIGVRTEAHRKMLKEAAPDLQVVLMNWC